MIDVVMPQMGESIVEGTLTKWLKKKGDHVERDEPLFEISTDKVDTEIPSPAAGVLSRDSGGRRQDGGDQHRGRQDRRSSGNGAAPQPAAAAPAPAARPRSASSRRRPVRSSRRRTSAAAARSRRRRSRWPRPQVRIRCPRRSPSRRSAAGAEGDRRTAVSAGAQDGAREQHRSAPGERHRRRRPHHQAGSGSVHVGAGREDHGPERAAAAAPRTRLPQPAAGSAARRLRSTLRRRRAARPLRLRRSRRSPRSWPRRASSP